MARHTKRPRGDGSGVRSRWLAIGRSLPGPHWSGASEAESQYEDGTGFGAVGRDCNEKVWTIRSEKVDSEDLIAMNL